VEKTKLKKCKVCKTRFRPFSSLAVVCTVECAIQWGAMERQRKARRERIEYKRDNVTKPQLTKRAQAAFNKWVRLRDHDKPCISCGVFNPGGDESGGKWDCGHFRTVGACPGLRFDPRNAHRQCKRCNSYLGGNFANYRLGLIDRIGLDQVELLERFAELKTHTREDLLAIAKDYNQKARDLAKVIDGN
jgi:hypothetical protein